MAETKKLGERLIEAGLITRDALLKALELQRSTPAVRLGDCLLSQRAITEQALLRFLATEFQTRYVSADKLAKVKVPTDVLDRVPVRMAESAGIIPIMYEAERKIMSIVMAEPQNVALITELKIVGGLSDVFVFIGTLGAINAAIKKHYYGDHTAFEMLDAAPPQAPAPEFTETTPPPRTDSKSAPAEALRYETSPRARAESIQKAASGTNVGASATSIRAAVDMVQRSSVMSDNDFVETLNVMVGLIELRRKDAFRSHSAAVAKHSRTIAQRMGLGHREVNHITIAAYLHDLGKRHDRHMTLLSANANAEWKADAKRYYKAPVKLFETVHLPVEVNSILAQLYEAFDGSGTPQGVKGEAIPAGARIISAVDSFEDLTKNAQNVFSEAYAKEKALDMLQDAAGTLFDPSVVDLMRQIHTGGILRARLLSEGRQAMICHADEGMRTDIRDALAKLGMSANVAISSEGLLDAIKHGEVDLVITDAKTKPDDACAVTAMMRQEPATCGLPVIFLTDDADERTLRDRVEGLRPAEILQSSVDPDVIAARAKVMLDLRIASGAPGRVVSGLIDEMSLEELLKTIASAQRSGRLTLRGAGAKGEIYIDKGRVVHVLSGAAKGEAAFDAIASFVDGDFSLDPNFLVLEQEIDKDVDVLLKESSQRRKRGPGPAPAASAPTTGSKKVPVAAAK